MYNKIMQWNKITNIILISAFVTLAVFVALGLYQWITRKSLKKVDKHLTFMPIPLALMAAVYVIFDKFWILNHRPNGSGEPSFPSTHVMVTATIFFITAIAIHKYIKSRAMRIVLDILMLALIVLTCFGRVLANMHWISDVIGGLIFAAIFAVIYYLTIRKENHE